MSLDNLKLNKQLVSAMADAGFSAPKEVQEKSMSRILGGQDIIGVGPEGIGKTTTFVLGVLMRLKYAQEEAPRALILVPDKESVERLIEKFQLLGKNTNLRFLGLVAGAGIEGQREELAEGTDVVIGTPDRIQVIYYKSGLNLNKLKMFIVDDADLHFKKGFHPVIHQLSQSIPKCQHLVFSEVVHKRLLKLTESFMNYPTLMEIDPEPESVIGVIEQVLYQVPNYKTKLNLLNLLMMDSEVFTEVVVFANSRTTAENLYKSLNRRITGEVAILNLKNPEWISFDAIEDFQLSEEVRVLVVASEGLDYIDIQDVPVILHFDVPADIETYISRVKKAEDVEADERLAITFSTDTELSQIKKIELAIGQKFTVEDLPPGLIIEGTPYSKDEEEQIEQKEKEEESAKGAAFHEKKASNIKGYNYSYKDRLKRFGKKNRPDKKFKG